MAAAADFDILPGLRDYSGAKTSKGGIDEMLAVIHHLSAAEVPSCVIGVKALRYYGAARITDEWDLCVPDDRLEEAHTLLLQTRNGDDNTPKYEVAKPPHPVCWSLRHTFPCFRLRGYNFWFILVPSSDCFVDPSNLDHVEKSRNGVPYASITQFARSLLLQNMPEDIADLVDGMDLDVEWGEENIGFGALQEANVEFIARRNRRVEATGDGHGYLSPRVLKPVWDEISTKEVKAKRIEPLKQGRYFTRWRRIKSPEDPRTKDRPV